MGKWNRRWRPRPRQYNYQEFPPSPPTPYRTQFTSRGTCETSMPSWEMNFCHSMGISWEKVVVSKKYMYCHDNVLKWDDSAGEEAFQSAKNRFWETINGLPCDTPLPDPKMYLDEIDWDPDIDPELMLELDREYFNPDEADKLAKRENTNRSVHNSAPQCTIIWNDKNPSNGDNPWECSHVQDTGTPNDKARGWDQWDKSMNVKNVDNPWENRYTEGDEYSKNSVWRVGVNKLQGWNEGINYTRKSDYLHNYRGNFQDKGFKGVGSLKQKGWGDVGNSSRGWNHWETSVQDSRKLDNGYNPWGNNFTSVSEAEKERGWADRSDDSWGRKQWGNQNNDPKHLDSRGPNGGGRYQNRGCRKREGSQQHTLRHKTLRFQGDDYGIGHPWRNERT